MWTAESWGKPTEFCGHYLHNPNFLWASLQLRDHALGEMKEYVYLLICADKCMNNIVVAIFHAERVQKLYNH